MNTDRITQSLDQLFREENARIVFWHDPNREFEQTLSDLSLEDVQLLRLDQNPALGVKVRLELEDPQGRYLLYAPFEQPAPEQDWLLDIRLYSRSFRADRASILLHDLGLARASLRLHLAERSKFFANRERLARLQRLVAPGDDELDLDRKILAVLVRADQPEFFNVLLSLCHAIPDGDLDAEPPPWQEIRKYGVEASFWQLVETHFGYRDEEPTLRNLLIRLLLSDFAQSARAPLPEALQHLLLPRHGAANAVVCLGQWRDSATRSASYEVLSARVADALGLERHLGGFEIEELEEVKTFLLVEQYIASRLRDRVIELRPAIDPRKVREIAARRQDGYWASPDLPDTDYAPRKALHAVYDALQAAAELFGLLNQYPDGFAARSGKTGAGEMARAYTAELYRFDQLYRHFCAAADYARSQDWDLLKKLRESVEDAYGNGYLARLALDWGKQLEGGLLRQWKIEGLPGQQRFFEHEIRPILDQSADRRVFVVISDAFRYEAARELTERLNGRYRFQAELAAQLGVLPSCTALGMAALLPHDTLAYNGKGAVEVDGRPCASLEQRGRILEAVGGIAIQADAFLALNKAQGRAFIKPWRVIYIYHNRIDAVGDSAATEAHTFDAVGRAIEELGDLVGKIVNGLNGNRALVTADHGFLFQERPPGEIDKSALPAKPPGTLTAKKRYLLGRGLPDDDRVYHGTTGTTAGAGGGMEFWIPRGANRFYFTGGARFIHGGAMPQEVIVPLIRVRQARGRRVEKTRTRTVGVSVLGSHFRVTTNLHRFRLIQTEPVSERIKPVTLKVALYDGEQPVTNVETVTFDSTSPDMNEWEKPVRLTLESRDYDRRTPYRLVLRNADTGVDELRMDVTIDLAFTNDF